MENKKGQSLFFLVVFGIIVVSVVGGLAIISYSGRTMDSLISEIDFTIETPNVGNQSFNETYQEMIHPAIDSLSINLPKMISIGLILGMICIMLLVSAFVPKRNNLWIPVDIGIIIIAELASIEISQMFKDYILNLTPELYAIFITTLETSSKWILQMPTIIPTVGVLCMVITYIFRKERKEEQQDEQNTYF